MTRCNPVRLAIVGVATALITATPSLAQSCCGTAALNVNNFGSQAAMVTSGWAFYPPTTRYEFLRLPNPTFCSGVPSTAYCGFDHPDRSLITLTLIGSGTLSFGFGNSWVGGTVTGSLSTSGGRVIASMSVGPSNSTVVSWAFQDGDVLSIFEDPSAVHYITGVNFSCPNPTYYATTAATARANATCVRAKPCSATAATPTYQASAATATSDYVCRSITPCPRGTYTSTAFTATSNNNCLPVHPCPAGTYEVAQATNTSDFVCAPLTPCSVAAGTHTVTNATATANFVCAPNNPCGLGSYQTAAATAFSDYGCAPITPCPSGTYIAVPASEVSNNVCEPVTVCSAGQIATIPATGTSDAVCGCPACASGYAQAVGTGVCPTCVMLQPPAPADSPKIRAQNRDISIDASTLTMHNVDIIGWISSLQAQVQRLETQNANLVAQLNAVNSTVSSLHPEHED